MKKFLVVLAVAVSSVGFGQAAFKLTDTIGHFGINESLDIFTGVWTFINNGDPKRDSLKRENIQKVSIDKLNEIRKASGMKALVYDARLKPAAWQNTVYNRYCLTNRVFQPGEEKMQRGKYTQTHNQRVNIPNFTEILYPEQRISLLDQTVFSKITEELTSERYAESKTYMQVAEAVWKKYKVCDGHWSALTKDTQWDCVYFYYDITNGQHVVILGKYK
jgi:hypothetical protein